MAFCKARGCELHLDTSTVAILGDALPPCLGHIEFAHLSDLKRRDPAGDIGAGLSVGEHTGIDGRVGGKAHWYVALGCEGQRTLRYRLLGRARAAWDALSDSERDYWEHVAIEQLELLREAKSLARAEGIG